jgi:hypothetical protein
MLRYMTLIIPAGYAQLVLGFQNPNLVTGRGAITLGFGSDLGPDPTSLLTWANGVAAAMADNFPDLFDNQTLFDSVYAANEDTSVQVSTNVAGVQTYTDPPPNVAILVSYTTAAKGRRGRGRNFLHGVCSEGEISEAGLLANDRRTAIQTAWDAFLNDVRLAADPEVNQVILQNTTPTGPDAPANPTPPLNPPPIVTAVTVQTRVATQRRRLRR